MLLLDFLIVLTLIGFTLFGFWFGLIHTIGSLVGTLVGTYIATRWFETLSLLLVGITGWNENTARVLVFIIIFVVVNRLIGFGFWIIDSITSIFTSLPFIRGANRFLGMLLGFLEGAITLGIIIYFIEKFPVDPLFMEQLARSRFAPQLLALANALMPLIPQALRDLKPGVDYVQTVVDTSLPGFAGPTSTMP